MPVRTTGVTLPSYTANNCDVGALPSQFKPNDLMKAIWLTMVASCVVYVEPDSMTGLLHDDPNANEIIVANVHTNNSLYMIVF